MASVSDWHPTPCSPRDEVRHRAPEPIQPPDHQHVAWGECRQRGSQAGALHLRPRDPLVVENLRAAGGGEGVQLEVELLVVCRHACLPDFHPSPRLPCALGSPTPLKWAIDFTGFTDHQLVYPRTFYTDLNGLWLLAEWH
jgi:hypothetical protein